MASNAKLFFPGAIALPVPNGVVAVKRVRTPNHRPYGIDVRPFGNLLRWTTVATGMGKSANVLHVRVAASRLVPVGRRPVALHFVGFRGDEYSRAVRVFGIPDFIHIGWDRWASQEVMPGDTAIFAKGTFEDAPSPYSYPDLHEQPNG